MVQIPVFTHSVSVTVLGGIGVKESKTSSRQEGCFTVATGCILWMNPLTSLGIGFAIKVIMLF